jgi:riboflavin kinase/FMN adenylyltransferase
MKYITETGFKLYNTAVSLGKFDGLHIGHRCLIDYVISMKKQGYQSAMFTFDLHPSALLSEKEVSLIYTKEEKKMLLKQMNLDVLVSYPFTEETAAMAPGDFVKKILIDKMDAKIIAVGEDFRFGHNREGDVALLQELSEVYGYQLKIFKKVTYENEIVSSSKIREELKKGNMKLVNQMLGAPYVIIGKVLHGRKIGRTIGMPTTNLIPAEDKLLPPNGVYASITKINGKEYPGISNIGYKPTVGADPNKGLETFIFDFDGDLYGKTIEVQLHAYERGEKMFKSLDDLKAQMQKDIAFGREIFASI